MSPDARADVERLWASYKARAAREVRDQLILHYSPLVKYVAGRVAVGLPQNVEQADLVSYGIFGLIDAIDKFDPDRGLQVRDLRHRPHQGRHPRRAALDRLGAPVGAGQGPGASRRPTPSSRASCTARRPTTSWPPSSSMTDDQLQTTLEPDLLRRPRRARRDARPAATGASP